MERVPEQLESSSSMIKVKVGSIVAGNERGYPRLNGKIGVVLSFFDNIDPRIGGLNDSGGGVNGSNSRWVVHWFDKKVCEEFNPAKRVFPNKWLTVIVP